MLPSSFSLSFFPSPFASIPFPRLPFKKKAFLNYFLILLCIFECRGSLLNSPPAPFSHSPFPAVSNPWQVCLASPSPPAVFVAVSISCLRPGSASVFPRLPISVGSAVTPTVLLKSLKHFMTSRSSVLSWSSFLIVFCSLEVSLGYLFCSKK